MSTQIRHAVIPTDLEAVRELFLEYLTWGNQQMLAHFGVHPHHPEQTVAEDIAEIEKFLPPNGQIFLAQVEDKICGIGCYKKFDISKGEIKRIYVQPAFRKLGLGKKIVQSLIDYAQTNACKSLLLDSPKFMKEAHRLYASLGFVDIEPYAEAEIPSSFQPYIKYMQLDLS